MDTLLIFAKAPIQGTVKTRLAETTGLDEEAVLRLYRAFLEDTLLMATHTGAAPALAYSPAEGRPVIEEMLEKVREERGVRVRAFPQVGEDFDARFASAMETVEGRVAVIGSDSPQLQPRTVKRAFSFLKRKGGMVLGPSGEGGVYLVGLNGGHGMDFRGVFTMGDELENLSAMAEERRMPLLLLEELTDVDVKADLITLVSNLKALSYSSRFVPCYLPRNTMAAIEVLGLRVVRSRGTREKELLKGR